MSGSNFRHRIYGEIAKRLLENGLGALAQANMHAAFSDPGNEHWASMSILNSAQAGELIIKAAIARVHPLLIFQNVFDFEIDSASEVSLEILIKKGKSHDFSKLPTILWSVCGARIEDMETFRKMKDVRNSLQHFLGPEGVEFGELSLRFIYQVIDPLLHAEFGRYAIDFHEDHSVGYDHLVGSIVRQGLKFSLPPDFCLGEIDLEDETQNCSDDYKSWLFSELTKIGKENLLPRYKTCPH